MGFLGNIGHGLLTFVLPALGTAIASLVVGVLSRFLQQQKIDLTDSQQARLRQLVMDAVMAVEEASRRRGNMTATQKDQLAKQLVLEHAQAENIPIPAGKLQLAVDAALPEMRAALAASETAP